MNVFLLPKQSKNEHPLLFDIDIKYTDNYTSRQLNTPCIQSLVEFLWSCIKEVIDIDTESKYSEIYVMLKDNPYPCSKKITVLKTVYILFILK